MLGLLASVVYALPAIILYPLGGKGDGETLGESGASSMSVPSSQGLRLFSVVLKNHHIKIEWNSSS